jgi:type I restriction enzyme, S subunit
MVKESKKALVPKLRFPEFQDEAGWANHKLSDLTEVVRGGSPRPIDAFITTEPDGLNWLKIGDVPKDSKYITSTEQKVLKTALSKTREVAPGDFILSNSMSFGRPYLSKIRTCIHDGWIAVTSLPDSFSRDFLYYSMMSEASQRYFENQAAGGGVRNLTVDIVKLLPVGEPLPAEQQKIADCLSSLDELIAAQGRKVEALKTYKRGLMQQLFPREGETLPRLRFPEFRDAPEWEEALLGDLFDTSSGGTPDRTKREYWNGDIPWVTTSLVDFNVIAKADEFISELGLDNSSAKVFPKGTVLIAMYGQGITRGKVAVLGIPAATNQACAAILPNDEVDSGFTFVSLCGRYEEMRKLSNSGGQENLSQALIRALPFRYPKDVEEQTRVVECFSEIDTLIVGEGGKLDALKLHKEGLMQQLFPSVEDTK